MMPVKFTENRGWKDIPLKNINTGLLELVVDGTRRADILTPKDSGALVNSSRIEPIPDGYRVSYGSSRVPYARRQFYENKRSPYYLTRGFEGILRGNLGKYFK